MPASQKDRLRISIVHPWDPWHQSIGGFDTFLDGFIKYAPPAWELELIGVTADAQARPPDRWQETDFQGRAIRFLPVLTENAPGRVRGIPLSLRFAMACQARRVRATGKLVVFHRFESSLALVRGPSGQRRVFYLHNHPGEVNSPHSDVRWARLPRLHTRLLLRQLKAASLIVCVDPRTPAWVAQSLPQLEAQVMFQRQWADPAIFRLADDRLRESLRRSLRRRLEWPLEQRLLVYAGRFEKQKDPLLLIEIAEQVCRDLKRVGLLLVGEGRLRSEIERAVHRKGLQDVVRLLPAVERDELASIYQGCDVAVCSSGFEAGPRHVFEGMACGLPVVSFDVGQVSDLVGSDCETGYLVKRRSVDAFVAGLACVLSSPLTGERAKKCVSRAAGFTPAASLAPILAAYEVVAGPGSLVEP